MLRIITQPAEAQTELQRLRTHRRYAYGDSPYDAEIRTQTATVQTILEAVRTQGNQALETYVEPIRQNILTLQQLRVRGSELDAAYQKIPAELLEAIRVACRQLEAFYQQRMPKSWVNFAEDDTVIGKRYLPYRRAGIYVERVSSVLMQAIPAKVAKVSEIVMVTPLGRDRTIHPALLVAAQEAGIEEVYRFGGAAAIAALAYGTDTITPVDVITGTGDFGVTLAKKLVNGTVAIDTPIDVSNLVIIADEQANPTQVAMDLVAQAEQDPTTAVIIFTTDEDIAQQIQQAVQQQLQQYPPGILTEKAIAHYSLIIVVDSLTQAVALTNQIMPQFLMLAVADSWEILESIRHAGIIFVGQTTPKVVGDFLGGSSLLPSASGSIRYSSVIGTETFLKPSTVLEYSPLALKKLSHTLETLAQAEGLLASLDGIRRRHSQTDSE